MSILAQEEQGGSAVRRIGQEVQKSAHERYCCPSFNSNIHVATSFVSPFNKEIDVQLYLLQKCNVGMKQILVVVVYITEVMMPVR